MSLRAVPRASLLIPRAANAPPFLCDCRKGLGNIGEMRPVWYDKAIGLSVWTVMCEALLLKQEG